MIANRLKWIAASLMLLAIACTTDATAKETDVQDEPTSPAPSIEPKAKPAETQLADLLAEIQAVKRATHHFQADLVFTHESDVWGKKSVTQGRIEYRGRGRARVTFFEKSGQVQYIEDGPFLWRVWPKENKAEKYFQGSENTVRALLDILSSSVDRLKQKFDITLSSAATQGHHLLTFAFLKEDPRMKINTITVEVDRAYRPIILTMAEDNGDLKRWALSNIVTNGEELAARDLRFVPGENTVVVDQFKAKGEDQRAVRVRLLDRALLDIVRERAESPYGWRGHFQTQWLESDIMRPSPSGRYWIESSGRFVIRMTTSLEDEGPTETYSFDGKTLRLATGLASDQPTKIREFDTEQLPGAFSELPARVRLLFATVSGRQFYNIADIKGVRPKREKNDENDVAKKKTMFSVKPTYEFTLNKTTSKTYGVKVVRFRIDRQQLLVTELTHAFPTDNNSMLDYKMILRSIPLGEPLGKELFPFSEPDGTTATDKSEPAP